MRVLCVAAHPDDEVLGCGATLAKHVDNGDEVHVFIFGRGRMAFDPAVKAALAAIKLGVLGSEEPRSNRLRFAFDYGFHLMDQRFDAFDLLDLTMWVERLVSLIRPGVVYTHWSHDRNKDHRIVADAVLTACRPVPGCPVRHLLQWETPSSTEWSDSGLTFAPNLFVEVTEEQIRRKMAALRVYHEEMRDAPHPRSYGNVSALAEWRGSTAGVMFAEAFVLVRSIE